MGFAKMMANKPQPKPSVQKEVPVHEVNVARDMTRCYELTRAPPNGIEAALKKLFPSMDVCVVNSVEVNGRALPSLFVHFSEDHKSAYDDYDRAAQVNISVQGIGLRLTAVAADKTDGDGCFIPKLNMLIQATGIPFYTMNSYGNYEKVENATCKVGIACRGYDASKASPLDFKKNMGQRQQII